VVSALRLYCGPVLRHPAELCFPAVELGGRVWLGGKPCKGGPAAPAFGGWRPWQDFPPNHRLPPRIRRQGAAEVHASAHFKRPTL